MNNKQRREKEYNEGLKVILKIKKSFQSDLEIQEKSKIIRKNNDLVSEVRNFRELSSLYQYAKNLDYSHKVYTSIQINNQQIRIQDDVVIYLDKQNCVAKVVEIIGVKNFQSQVPIVKIQWYYSKSDLLPILKGYKQYIGSKELFLSDQYDFIQPDTIVDIANIKSYEDYEQQSTVGSNIYFMRALFIKNQIKPALNKWTKHCICEKPLNPDLTSIQCDKCNKWFHESCVSDLIGMTKIESEQFICRMCQ